LRTGVSEFYPSLDWQINLRSVKTLLTIADKHGVKISIENMPEPFPFLLKSVQDFTRFYNEVDSNIDMTLDVGHANINSQALDLIDKFSKKIVHIHASDNEGNYDTHCGIGHGKVNWKAIADALNRMSYKSIFMLESVEHIEESLQTLHELFG
jgi:sugar phosphate isomerase/epimerase